MTRRALLGAGAAVGAATFAGCGSPGPVTRAPADVLGGPLAAERALQGVLASAPEALARGLAARSRARAARLRAAGASETTAGWTAAGPDAAYGRLLVTHVDALPLLPPRPRAVVAGVLREAAADQATLRARARRDPVALPFPGRPSRP